MPVTWEFQSRLLVLRLVGNYNYDTPVRAVVEAMADPAFQPGTMLLVDARLSTTRRSSDDFRERAIWMASLRARGFAARCALLINSQPHQFGMARMAATHLEMRGMEFEIFTDSDKAAQWLLGGAAAKQAGISQHA